MEDDEFTKIFNLDYEKLPSVSSSRIQISAFFDKEENKKYTDEEEEIVPLLAQDDEFEVRF